MIEQVYKFSVSDEKVMERVIIDENLNFIHMLFNKGEGTPEHYTNGNVYMAVVRGTLSIKLGEQDTKQYERGTVLKIPNNVKMLAENLCDDVLELIIVKAPAPKM